VQIIVTHGRQARARTLHCSRLGVLGALVLLVALGAGLVMSAASWLPMNWRPTWTSAQGADPAAEGQQGQQRERMLRDNLDAMAQKLGEMQAKLIRLEAMGDRVSGLAGLKANELKAAPTAAEPGPRTPSSTRQTRDGRGGLYLPLQAPSMDQLHDALAKLEAAADHQGDILTFVEARLLESRLRDLMVPSSAPVPGPVGSSFGFRFDPFTGRGALHSGLDFPAPTGTPILAAAGGVVVAAQAHPQYGLMLEIDHGNKLVTRYAHASRLDAKPGDLVRRGQMIAKVGSTGRSTGPHLHFEVLVNGAHQDPGRFLAASPTLARAGR
jgi:murein DD-endopeptidase MepM/ murein hydrolase activator NlpD